MESNTFKWGAKKERIESTVAMDGFKAFKFVCALNRVNVLVETLDGIAAYSEEWMNITYRRSMRHIHTTPYTHSYIYISFDMYISCICICYLYTLWISMYMHRLILLLPYFSQPNQIHVNCTARKNARGCFNGSLLGFLLLFVEVFFSPHFVESTKLRESFQLKI